MTRKKLGFMNVHSEEVLSRNEMKSIMAGSGDCTPGNDCTNCVICPNNSYCISHVGPEPHPDCSYGICPGC